MVISINDKPIIEPYTVYVEEVSFERFLEFANEDIACELVDGVLIIHSPASYIHESIFSFLMTYFKIFGQKSGVGKPIGSRFVMKLSEKWAPEPDIMFLTKKDQERLKETFLEGPATLVVEILSKSTREEDIEKKLPKYLSSGVAEVWIVDPKARKVHVHQPNGPVSIISKGWIVSKAVIGLKVDSAWLWKPDDVDVLEAIINAKNG